MRSMVSGLLLAALIAAFDGNFSGKWVIERSGRGQTPQITTLILNQVGAEVGGSISARIDAGSASPVNTEILDGKVEGDTITFYVWTGLDRPVKAFYKGTLSGDEIKFTVTGGAVEASGFGGPSPGAVQADPQQVVAKRSK